MSKKNQNQPSLTPITRFVYVVRQGGKYVGSPLDARVSKAEQAATWEDEAQAAAVALAQGGVVATKQIVDQEATLAQQLRGPVSAVPSMIPGHTNGDGVPATPLPEPAKGSKGTKAPKPAASTPEATTASQAKPTNVPVPKAPKGPAHEDVFTLLKLTGLPLTEKSASHFGGHTTGKTLKGPRLVLPRGKHVTRLYLYEMPEATALSGYKTPEERKAQGLGAVTHVADITTMEQVKALVTAVCEANGIALKQDMTPRAKRSKKATPAQGTLTVVESDEEVRS